MAAPWPPSTTNTSSRGRTRESEKREIIIGNFKRLGQIGQGSFAIVYKAQHVNRSSLVAIKSVLLSRLNKKLKDNLFGEINILRELHHPNIVGLFDCHESTTHIHLVMEYCPMGDLAYFMRKKDGYSSHADFKSTFQKYPNPRAGGLHEVLARHFFQQLASALLFLRNKSLIHRDVKPQNLLILPPRAYYDKPRPDAPYFPKDWTAMQAVGVESLPTLKLADFGFARSLPKTALAETLCGSPLYMAPEILRYEKYDGKADLWSVGTVTFEMLTGKPPFRASNHIELLRKIETAHDNIKFPEDPAVSKDMREVVRALLKRGPVERISFNDFFNHSTVKGDIPGLVEEDRKLARTSASYLSSTELTERPAQDRTKPVRRVSSGRETNESDSQEKFHDAIDYPTQQAARRPSLRETATAPAGQHPHVEMRVAQPTPPQSPQAKTGPPASAAAQARRQDSSGSGRRPSVKEDRPPTAGKDVQELESIKERAAQDVAFERDYVVVEKRAVEVNAFADEMAASPRVQYKTSKRERSPQQMALLRRNTTHNTPTQAGSPSSTTPSRAVQVASAKPAPQQTRQEQPQEKRNRSSSSTTSAISKAVAMASGRLFNFGISPPVALPMGGARGTPSPPIYGPFPTYPTTGGALAIAEGKASAHALDEDMRALQAIEESAHRSDVVYGFAEVKYKQLIPLAPSASAAAAAAAAAVAAGSDTHADGLGLQEAGIPSAQEEDEDGLTADAIVTLSEEALVLYVKSLSLLAHSMDVAGAWWASKNQARASTIENRTQSEGPSTIHPAASSSSTSSSPSKTPVPMSSAAAARMNKVVQWVRDRFNEVLEKAEFVRLKLLAAQRRLPPDHPSHPSNHPIPSITDKTTTCSGPTASGSGSVGTRIVTDDVHITPGVSAERLMYTRALEMGKSAAVNELVCEDLAGCEIAYFTAIRMLEAVLDTDDESLSRKISTGGAGSQTSGASGATGGTITATDTEGGAPQSAVTGQDALVEAGDREHIQKVVQGFRGRLYALRGKLHVLKEREASAAGNAAGSHSSRTKSPVAPRSPVQRSPVPRSPTTRSPVLAAAQMARTRSAEVAAASTSPRSR